MIEIMRKLLTYRVLCGVKDSISFKFNVLAVLCVTVLLVGFGWYNYSSTKQSLSAQQEAQVNLLLDRLQLSLPATLWNFETEQTGKILESEVQAEFVSALYLYDGKKLLASRSKSKSGELISGKRILSRVNLAERQLTYDDGGKVHKVGRAIILKDNAYITTLLDETLVRLAVQTLVLDAVLAFLLLSLMRSVVISPINEVIHALEDIAHGEGDLTQRLKEGKGEIGELSTNFNLFVEKIQTLIKQIVDTMNSMNTSVSDMGVIADRTSKGVDHQRSETDQAAVAMNEMSTASGEVSHNASEAADSAHQAEKSVMTAKAVLTDTVQSVTQLAEEIQHGAEVVNALQGDVGNIVAVLDVIRGIAEQTNLLALNAAIEAARAGEQGRGFAVVADEVRTLASRTQESTQEIQEMIERLQSGASEAVKVMEGGSESSGKTVDKANAAEGSLDEITVAITTISDMITQIAHAVEEQTTGSEDINRALSSIVDIAETTATDTNASKDGSNNLINLCDELGGQVSRFKV